MRMELYENMWDKSDALETVTFCINQLKRSKLTLSEIQHNKFVENLDYEEIIGALLMAKNELENYKFFKEKQEEN